jgi:hypothetical protein
MEEAIHGGIASLSMVAGLYFLRFWRQTADTFFAYFSAAFFVFGVQRILLVVVHNAVEHHSWLYMIRLFGHILILTAIWHKNRKPSSVDAIPADAPRNAN